MKEIYVLKFTSGGKVMTNEYMKLLNYNAIVTGLRVYIISSDLKIY